MINLTILPVEANLSLVLLLAFQSFVDLLDHTVAGFGSMKEAAGAGFLHHLCSNKACQFTEAI